MRAPASRGPGRILSIQRGQPRTAVSDRTFAELLIAMKLRRNAMAQAAASDSEERAYVLGHAPEELERLIGQGRYFGDLTADVLRQAGLAPGMRVLDAGCGAGDVSFLAARLVGPAGLIIGVDKSPEAVATAARRAAAAGLPNVRFLTNDVGDLAYPAELDLEAPVDALIGRMMLMHFPEPAAVLRRLATLVRPGGIVAFHEMDIAMAAYEPTGPLFATAHRRIMQTFTRLGVDIRAGLKLGQIFEAAGLPAPRMILGARVERGPDAAGYDQIAQITRTLLPAMERTGVATVAEVGIETLADRLRDEAIALDATLVSPGFIGAWTRIDAAGDPPR